MVICPIVDFIFCMLNNNLYQQERINVTGCLGIFILEQLMFYFTLLHVLLRFMVIVCLTLCLCKKSSRKIKKSASLCRTYLF